MTSDNKLIWTINVPIKTVAKSHGEPLEPLYHLLVDQRSTGAHHGIDSITRADWTLLTGGDSSVFHTGLSVNSIMFLSMAATLPNSGDITSTHSHHSAHTSRKILLLPHD
jgi:hypothetical protein